MDEHGIRALGASVDKLIKVIDQQTKDLYRILSPLNELPELTRDTQEAVQHGLSDLQGIIVQLRLVEIGTEMDAYEGMAEAEKRALQEKVDELASDVERISERYRELLEDLDATTEESVRELDDPVLALLEHFYPEIVEARYADRLLPGRRAVAAKANQTARTRGSVLEQGVRRLSDAVTDFLDAREEGLNMLARLGRDRPSRPFERSVAVRLMRSGGRTEVAADSPDRRTADEVADRVRSTLESGELRLHWRRDKPGADVLALALENIAGESASLNAGTARTARFLARQLDEGAIETPEVAS